MLKIGSHVDMTSPLFLEGSVKKALSYKANALMVYTGAPQNSKRRPVSELHVDEALQLLKENDIDYASMIVHAPYLINLANTENDITFETSKNLLKQEIERTAALNASYLVLHPGSSLKAEPQEGINKIIEGLNEVLDPNQKTMVLLETMAGKGSEVGRTIDEIATIIKNTKHNELLGVCLDTCHLHDAGYDLNKIDEILDEIDAKIGLEKVKCVHINDSKNECGAHKDRHENIGYGKIGFDILMKVVYNERLKDVVKILETPYINHEIAPYEKEIQMIRNNKFEDLWHDIKDDNV